MNLTHNVSITNWKLFSTRRQSELFSFSFYLINYLLLFCVFQGSKIFENNFDLPGFDRFTRFGMSWVRFGSVWKMSIALCSCMTYFVRNVAPNLRHNILWKLYFRLSFHEIAQKFLYEMEISRHCIQFVYIKTAYLGCGVTLFLICIWFLSCTYLGVYLLEICRTLYSKYLLKKLSWFNF